jgi:hypothetical protein
LKEPKTFHTFTRILVFSGRKSPRPDNPHERS